jgi:hypothetical protein
LPHTKPPHQSGLISSFNEHHAKVKVEPGNRAVKVKEEQFVGQKKHQAPK